MPVIHLEYDDQKISDGDVEALSKAVRDIVSDVTGIEDVFVYANTARVKVQIAPVELFIQMSAHKIKDVDALVAEIKTRIQEWKAKNNFTTLVNMSFIPMNWKIEIGI